MSAAIGPIVDRHLYDDRLTADERHVLLVHRHVTAAEGYFSVTVAALAEATGLTVARVEAAVDGLIEKGWLAPAAEVTP
jgi:DNA-binding MarR family transcriptional regulator